MSQSVSDGGHAQRTDTNNDGDGGVRDHTPNFCTFDCTRTHILCFFSLSLSSSFSSRAKTGALCVGSITITPSVGTFVTKGESLGYFQFGGSTIAVLFERDRIIFDSDLIQHSRQKIESLVQMGTTLATTR